MSYTCTGSDELQVSDNGSGGVTFTTCGDSCYLLYSDTVQFTSTGGEALDTGGSSAIHVLSSEQLQGYGMGALTDTPTATRYYVLASMGSASDSYITKANANATVVPSSASTITSSSVTATLSGSAVSIDYEIASFTNDDMDYYALYYGDSSECPTSMDLMGGGETECTFVQRMDSESGTVTNVAAPSTGVKRWYFIINIAPSPGSVVASASITGQAQAISAETTITDFTAEVVTGGVQCQFTAPAGISTAATVQWQRTTTDPDSGTPTWTTVATTDLSGTAVTI